MQHEHPSLLVAPHPEGGAADAKRKPPAARAPAENAKRGKSAAASAKPTTAAVHGITAVSSEPSELPAKHPEAADEVRSPARCAAAPSVRLLQATMGDDYTGPVTVSASEGSEKVLESIEIWSQSVLIKEMVQGQSARGRPRLSFSL